MKFELVKVHGFRLLNCRTERIEYPDVFPNSNHIYITIPVSQLTNRNRPVVKDFGAVPVSFYFAVIRDGQTMAIV